MLATPSYHSWCLRMPTFGRYICKCMENWVANWKSHISRSYIENHIFPPTKKCTDLRCLCVTIWVGFLINFNTKRLYEIWMDWIVVTLIMRGKTNERRRNVFAIIFLHTNSAKSESLDSYRNYLFWMLANVFQTCRFMVMWNYDVYVK